MTLAVNIAQGGSSNVTFRNRIINGGMVIDQRNAGASYTQPVNQSYGLDRWFNFGGITSKFTVQQNAGSVTPPSGFKNYLGVTSLSSYSVGSGDYYMVGQNIEGLNVYDFAWGTANAKTITLSFWAYSSLTGTFGGSLQNSAVNRSYPFSYTISSANTWTQVSITVAGDTSGTWLTTNGIGLTINFGLGVGSTYSGTAGSWAGSDYRSATGATSVVGTSGATFYITGVQLEAGTTASPFEYRQYGTELALCQRYFETSYDYGTAVGTVTNAGCVAAICYNTSTNRPFLYTNFKVTKRTTPTITPYNPYTGGSGTMNGPSNAAVTSNLYYQGFGGTNFYASGTGSATSNGDYYQHWTASAEL